MESLEIYSLIKQVVALSEKMLGLAHQAHWISFEKTEQQRQKLLTKIFEHQSINEMLPKIANFLRQVLDYDCESIQLSEQARSDTVQELSAIHTNVHAVGAYQELSTFEPSS
ncbi:MAG: flagellar protein FliT [Gammaproteobacteria bacterium]